MLVIPDDGNFYFSSHSLARTPPNGGCRFLSRSVSNLRVSACCMHTSELCVTCLSQVLSFRLKKIVFDLCIFRAWSIISVLLYCTITFATLACLFGNRSDEVHWVPDEVHCVLCLASNRDRKSLQPASQRDQYTKETILKGWTYHGRDFQQVDHCWSLSRSKVRGHTQDIKIVYDVTVKLAQPALSAGYQPYKSALKDQVLYEDKGSVRVTKETMEIWWRDLWSSS